MAWAGAGMVWAIKGGILRSQAFGAEGSIITMVICVAIAVYFTKKAIASGRIVSPFWRRRGPDGFYVTLPGGGS